MGRGETRKKGGIRKIEREKLAGGGETGKRREKKENLQDERG